MPLPISRVVVSWPASSSKTQVEYISPADSRSPSSSAAMSWPIKSCEGAWRFCSIMPVKYSMSALLALLPRSTMSGSSISAMPSSSLDQA